MTNRSKMIAKGMGLIVAVAAFIVLMSLLANMPGLTGEIFSKILGIMFTPFFLEASLALSGTHRGILGKQHTTESSR